MKSLILGYGKSGKAAESFLKEFHPDEKIVIFDDFLTDSLSPIGTPIVSKLDSNALIQKFDRLIPSPGFSLNHPLILQAKKENIPLVSEIELALEKLSLENLHTIIGVTGSNGKTTTTHLIAHLFNASQIFAKAVGNNGIPLTSVVKEILLKKTFLILELSSYQIDLLSKKFLHAGVLLNIFKNHLDRYENFETYAKSKFRITELFYNEKSPLITFASVKQKFLKNNAKKEKVILVEKRKDFFSSIHQSDNLLAALTTLEFFHVPLEKVIDAIVNFQKPEHRVEFVAEINGVSFYNDSKATNAEAVLFALEALQGKVLLIAGGEDKKLSYTSWQKPFLSKVKKIFAIGKIAKQIQDELPQIVVRICSSLEEAVELAYREAKPKDHVLLSPGTSSFDMFLNFEERGKKFKECVSRLKYGRVL